MGGFHTCDALSMFTTEYFNYLPVEENGLLKQGKEIRHLLRSICVRTKIDYDLVLILWKQMYPTVVVREYDINLHFHITYTVFMGDCKGCHLSSLKWSA